MNVKMRGGGVDMYDIVSVYYINIYKRYLKYSPSVFAVSGHQYQNVNVFIGIHYFRIMYDVCYKQLIFTIMK